MIDEIEKQLKPLINGKLIYLSQYGSHLYGLNTENSDLDFRGVYIPTIDDIILHKDKDEINTEIILFDGIKSEYHSDNYFDVYNNSNFIPNKYLINKKKIDVKIFSLQKFIQLCSKADTNALDLLFSIDTPADHTWQYKGLVKNVPEEMKYPLRYIHENRNKLINTDRLESPITYAFKQATKYGLKGERLKVLENILQLCKEYQSYDYQDVPLYEFIEWADEAMPWDDKHLKVDILDNKGKKEKYLFVCGVQHQFNLSLKTFTERIEEKIDKEYTSERTKNSKDGNDWKALSHAIRVLLEVQELLETGGIKFPLKNKDFIKDIKLGKVNREDVDKFFNKELKNILDLVQQDVLQWKYDEQFWNEFILKEVKNG